MYNFPFTFFITNIPPQSLKKLINIIPSSFRFIIIFICIL
ncbi:hypothetical protein BP951000_0556 [Brachyspira pilosicoli 95/1000]|uniref:Uncharacterized protein n=1 Tax=Brachyspira pilosicoli (strain ATCC BAA-1826 / 95/1000) TaxID=759914 RepID=D8IBN4_BRAP9|nr:hypothetical protein BP951000_0556 [Brachyspira pilosicoli 95/1000]